jgi:hypothetical protein
MEEPH